MVDTEEPVADQVPGRAGLSGGLLSIIFVLVVGAGALVAWLAQDDGTGVAATGEPAPVFAVPTFDGDTFDLGEHIDAGGGPVLLNLWASWCKPCLEEFPVLADYARTHPEITVVGVAVQDNREDAGEFVDRMNPPFTAGFDADNVVRETYPAFGLPVTVLIDSEGTVRQIITARLTPERLAEIPTGV